jgi:Kdo2-lipid IVA lauroyltransferase/acyltransferase
VRWLRFPFKGIAAIIARSPWVVQRALGKMLGIFWFDILRIRRQVVLNNLAIAFPAMTLKERVRLGRQSMIEFCTNLVQYFWLPFLRNERFRSRIVFSGLENLDRGLAQKRGVLILTLHLGNGDLAMGGLALKGYPVQVISKLFKTQWLNDLWFGMREKLGVGFIAPRDSSFSLLRSLKRNQCIIFVLDQFTGPPIGLRTTFFGRETGTAMGLAVVAERSGAAVIPAYNLRRADGSIEVVFSREIPYISGADRDEGLARMTQVYTDELEQYVRRCPEQWMWLHKRWKKFKV